MKKNETRKKGSALLKSMKCVGHSGVEGYTIEIVGLKSRGHATQTNAADTTIVCIQY